MHATINCSFGWCTGHGMADLSYIAPERAAVPTGRRRNCRAALLATTTLVAVGMLPGVARAADATWLASPGSGDFNTGTNWNPAARANRHGLLRRVEQGRA